MADKDKNEELGADEPKPEPVKSEDKLAGSVVEKTPAVEQASSEDAKAVVEKTPAVEKASSEDAKAVVEKATAEKKPAVEKAADKKAVVEKVADKKKASDKKPDKKIIDVKDSKEVKDVKGAKDAKDAGKSKYEPPKPVQLGGESLLDRLLPHIKKIAVGAIVLAVVIGGYFVIRNRKLGNRAYETEKLAAVIEAGAKPIARADSPPDPVKNPGFKNQKERAEAMLAEAVKQDVTLDASFHAALLVDAERVDDAIAKYRTCELGLTLEHVQCREGLGIAIEAKARAEKDAATRARGYQEALDVFNRMQPADDGPRRVYAVYHQARLLLLLEKKEEGKKLLEEAKKLSPPLDLAQVIELRLQGLGAS